MHMKPALRLVGSLPECDVCGQVMHDKLLRPWNEQKVCRSCIDELTADYPEGGETTNDRKAKTGFGRQGRQGAAGR